MAVDLVREGAHAEALALQDETGTRLYTLFAQLLVDVANQDWIGMSTQQFGVSMTDQVPSPPRELVEKVVRRTELDLRHFSRYVRLRLRQLIDDGEIPDDPFLSPPVLGRHVTDSIGWLPSDPPPGWNTDTQLDPNDPQYRPPNLRT
jgi:hypothetical protein